MLLSLKKRETADRSRTYNLGYQLSLEKCYNISATSSKALDKNPEN